MTGLDRRVQRLEAQAAAAYWARVAALFTARLGQPYTPAEAQAAVAEAQAAAAPYLARGLSLPAAYAAVLGVPEATVWREAQAIADALGD